MSLCMSIRKSNISTRHPWTVLCRSTDGRTDMDKVDYRVASLSVLLDEYSTEDVKCLLNSYKDVIADE